MSEKRKDEDGLKRRYMEEGGTEKGKEEQE